MANVVGLERKDSIPDCNALGENLGLGFLSKAGLISEFICYDGMGGEGRGGAAKCSELHERAMRCIRRKLRLRLCERAVCVVGG